MKQFKYYGLKSGTTLYAKRKPSLGMIYPWGGIEVPVRVEAEYPTFILATVLPHRSTKGFGISRPYRVTFHKHDIMIGDIILNGGDKQIPGQR